MEFLVRLHSGNAVNRVGSRERKGLIPEAGEGAPESGFFAIMFA
jgi:hypothetical protein